MGVFGTVIKKASLGNLVDKHEESGADKHALPERIGDHVQCLVIDPVQLLQPLQVIKFTRCIRNSPHSQVVHVTQVGPVVREWKLLALFLNRDEFVLKLHLANIVSVFDGFTGFLKVALENVQFIATHNILY